MLYNNFVAELIRRNKLFLLFFSDILSMLVSMFVAFYLLTGPDLVEKVAILNRFWWVFFLSIAFRIGVFRNFGLYHWAWQYMSVKEVLSLIKAILLSSALIALSVLAFGRKDFPFTVLLIELVLCFAFVGGIRFLIRIWKESLLGLDIEGEKRRVLIVGAGDAGEMILREMQKLSRYKYKPIGFVDDNPLKKEIYIHHLPVLGNCEDIPAIVRENKVDEIVIAVPSANRKQIKRIVSFCEQSSAKFRIVPGIYELIDGTVHVNQIRKVEIEDLLGREPVKLDIRSISSRLTNVNVLITGAGGSIGSELCRQVAMYNPSKLILLGKGENSIFEIEMELKSKFPFLSLASYIADIRDANRMNQVFKRENPEVVFHAAAHKHVSLMENAPEEAVMNNIIGTKNMVDLSVAFRVVTFVMISTDKAVNPVCVMGQTKRIAEMIVQAKALEGSQTKFVSVRFGNVLGSRGSVVPIFKKQIAAGGPVTITHPEVQRYFMTIPEAVQLVIQAGTMGNGGEIFILDMGEPVKILDLANDLIRLSGLEVGIDIEIKYTGLKPGEKMLEEILTGEEGKQSTKHEKIFISSPKQELGPNFFEDIKMLENLAKDGKIYDLKNKLREMV